MLGEPFFFIQLSDPQLGVMVAAGRIEPELGIGREVALFESAIAEANRLKPDFVMVTGDLSHNNMDPVEVAEIKRAVFRALTRLRAATIKEFDTIARLETQAIDAYNDAHTVL